MLQTRLLRVACGLLVAGGIWFAGGEVVSAQAPTAPAPRVVEVRPAVGGPRTEFSFRWYSFGACGTCEGEQLYVYGPAGTRCSGNSREHPFLQFRVGVGSGDPREVRTFFGPHFGVGRLPRPHHVWCPGRYHGEITTDEPQTIHPSPYTEYAFSFRVRRDHA